MRRAGLALALLASTGCSLIVHQGQTTQQLRIETDPPGAVAATPDGQSCQTPCELRVGRAADAVVTVEKEGHAPDAVLFRSRLSETTLLNLVFSLPGIALGIPIDLLTGAGYDVIPSGARLQLEPLGAGTHAPASPAPRELAPRPPGRLALGVQLGGGTAVMDGQTAFISAGVQGTFRVGDRFVVGAAFDAGAEFALWGGGGGMTTVAALGGVEGRPTPNSRALALLQVGRHRYIDAPEEHAFPAIGARGEWCAVFGDALLLGGFVGYLRDLDHADATVPYGNGPTGGDTVVMGFSLGWLAL